jgi:hypothetical protein
MAEDWAYNAKDTLRWISAGDTWDSTDIIMLGKGDFVDLAMEFLNIEYDDALSVTVKARKGCIMIERRER